MNTKKGITFRLELNQKDQLETLAAESGLSLAEYCRWLVINAINRQITFDMVAVPKMHEHEPGQTSTPSQSIAAEAPHHYGSRSTPS